MYGGEKQNEQEKKREGIARASLLISEKSEPIPVKQNRTEVKR